MAHTATTRRELAGAEFNRMDDSIDGLALATNLAYGLNCLRDLFYERIHDDVESTFGMDSMLAPVSEEKTEHRTKVEIELYQVAVSAAATETRSLTADTDWYARWLMRFRLGDKAIENDSAVERLERYVRADPEARRLHFERVLQDVMPEATKAPLVLFRLYPMAIAIATFHAFQDNEAAAKWRGEQKALLPAIADCRKCQSQVLENGDRCDSCGNPVWKFKWLTATD